MIGAEAAPCRLFFLAQLPDAMKFGVIVFPGSNCDEDMVYVLRHLLGQQVVKLWHKEADLQGCDVVVLPGGFSYGDYLRSGAIARFSPIMGEVARHAASGGYVLGICNGFQILTEAGLLPGVLLPNDNQRFVCRNQHIIPATAASLLTAHVPAKAYNIPIAHADGRFYAPPAMLEEIQAKGQILFRYCDAAGKVTAAANPNGSVDNIAGVCNAARNVMGMMPHPERAADEVLGNTDGRVLFESMLATIGVH